MGAGGEDIQRRAQFQTDDPNVGHARLKTCPGRAAIVRRVDADVVADIEDVGARIQDDRAGGRIGKVAADVRPVLTEIAGAKHVSPRSATELIDHDIGDGLIGRIDGNSCYRR